MIILFYDHWKAHSGIPISVNWTFFAEALRAIICSKSAISLQRGPADPKFQVEGVAPTNHSFSQKIRLNDLSYGIKIWTDFSSLLSQLTRLTDGRTERILIARPRLHSMQRGTKTMDGSFFRFVTMHALERRTDWLTNSFLVASQRWHSMHRGTVTIGSSMPALQ